ncbi:MAG: hypothetical protein R3F61_10900 [Myxococcota bacterium]
MTKTRVRPAKALALFGFAALLGGCTSPLHLTYDHGRAFTEAFTAQADLTRPSIANATYNLYGKEAADIRLRVQETTTDKETDKSEIGN